MPLLPLLLLPLLPAPRAEGGDVVSLVRENYVSYEDARKEIDPADLARAEAAAASGDPEGTDAYLRLWGDPRLKRVYRDNIIKISNGSLELYELMKPPSPGSERRPLPKPTPRNPDGEELAKIATGRGSVIFDLRGKPHGPTWRLALTVEALPFVVARRSVTLASVEMRASPGVRATWKGDVADMPGGASAYAKLMGASTGARVRVVEPRALPLKPMPGLKRIALLVNTETSTEGIQFAALAQRDTRVRVFGSPTGPPTLGERELALPAKPNFVLIPTARLRGVPAILPDEDVRSLSPELRRAFKDAALFRADQWCRLGQ